MTMSLSSSQDDGSSWLDLWEYVLDDPQQNEESADDESADEESTDDDSQDDNSSFLDCLSPGDEKPTKRCAFGTRFWRRSKKEEESAHYDYLEQQLSAPLLDRDEERGEKWSERKLEKRPRKKRLMLSRLICKAHQAEDDITKATRARNMLAIEVMPFPNPISSAKRMRPLPSKRRASSSSTKVLLFEVEGVANSKASRWKGRRFGRTCSNIEDDPYRPSSLSSSSWWHST
jgi:hypothetical protein